MRLVQYETADGEPIEFVEFTADELSAIAKWVMDCLCLPWMDTRPEFRDMLMLAIHRGSAGKDMTADLFEGILDKYERYVDKPEYKIPRLPRLKTNGSRLTAPKEIHGKEIKGAAVIEWLRKRKALMWYDQWDNHPHMRRRVGMWVFPNHEPDGQYEEHQYQLEERFWLEVDRRQAEYECSRSEAIRAVSDTHRRAVPEHQLPDPALDD